MIFFAGAGLLLAAVGIGGWTHWVRSPRYSLLRLAEAVEGRNRYEMERYVDLDALIESFTSALAADNAIGLALLPSLTAGVRQEVSHAVEDGTFSSDSRVGQAAGDFLRDMNKIDPERTGPNAYFGFPVRTKGGATFSLKFHMVQHPDGYWRLDRATNVKDLLALEASEEKTRIAALKAAAKDEIAKLEVVAKLHTALGSGSDRTNLFQVRFKNNAEKPLLKIRGQLRNRKTGFEQPIDSELHLAAGAIENMKWGFDVNPLEPESTRMFAMGETDQFEVNVTWINFADGTIVDPSSVK